MQGVRGGIICRVLSGGWACFRKCAQPYKHIEEREIISSDNLPTPSDSENAFQHLLDLATSIASEVKSLVREETFLKPFGRSGSASSGINFYDEVARFEARLIRLALAETKGHQARASRLLKLRPTTLNSKMKQLGITPRPAPPGEDLL